MTYVISLLYYFEARIVAKLINVSKIVCLCKLDWCFSLVKRSIFN